LLDRRLFRVDRERAGEELLRLLGAAEAERTESGHVERLDVARLPRRELRENAARALAVLRLEERLSEGGLVPVVRRKRGGETAVERGDALLRAALRVDRGMAGDGGVGIVVAVLQRGEERVVRLVEAAERRERLRQVEPDLRAPGIALERSPVVRHRLGD